MGSFSIFAGTEDICGVKSRSRSSSNEISGVRLVIASFLKSAA